MSDKTPEQLAQEAGEKGTFSFADRLVGRSYAKDDVVVNLDEELGYLLTRLQDARDEELDDAKRAELDKKIAKVVEQLRASEYTIHMEGFSNERHDELAKIAKQSFPLQYDTITSPLTGEKSKQVKEVPERDELFSRLIWKESIKYVEDSKGNIDNNIDDAFIDSFLKNAPQAAITRVANTIDKLRVATDWIEATQDEDFLAKP